VTQISSADSNKALSDLLIRLQKLHPRKIDLSLDRSKKLLKKLGNPEKKIHNPIIIAGTNGKGSTTNILKSILEAHGKTCSSYISPNLVKVNERIIFEDEEISDEFLTEVLLEAERVNNGDVITYFEIFTCAAFLAYSKKKTDYSLLEIGLGGRFDPVSLAANPKAYILCPISMDHKEFLGDTIEKIAREKIGAVKYDSPIIISKQTPEVLKVFDEHTKNIKSQKIIYGEDFQGNIEQNNKFIYQDEESLLDLNLPNLLGSHQVINASVAIRTAKLLLGSLDTKKINKGIVSIKHKGRLEIISKGKLRDYITDQNILICDGSHNSQGGEVTNQYLQTIKNKKIYMICGMINSKDPKEFLKHFTSTITALKTITIPNQENAIEAKIIANIGNEFGIKSSACSGIIEALRECSNEDPNAVIIFSGSLYGVGEFLKLN
jgi:dihydrofolate synthase / folylpolyglutamate synthase